jgi:hypothetical protein
VLRASDLVYRVLNRLRGSGQAVLARIKTNPHRLGYDISGGYPGVGGNKPRPLLMSSARALLDLMGKEDTANQWEARHRC